MNMDYIYSSSVPYIQDIQSRFSENENFLYTVSHISDPAYIFSIIIPIFSTVDTMLTANVLMVSIIAEWLNTILKWFIMEDRPYWWIREHNINNIGYPYIKQGPLTCETGPGCPSGHVMGTAAVLYVVINACISHYSARMRRSGRNNKLILISFWSLYVALLILVSISRIYLATHFPHQCLLGAILGFFIGYYFGNLESKATHFWHTGSKLQLLSFVLCSIIISVSAYWIQKAFGIDPQWSVKMAFKWCESVDNVHVSTTPLFSLIRDTGLGLGMVSISPVILKASNKHNILVSVACVLVFCTALHLAQAAIPTHDVKIFYSCHALLFSTMPFILIGVLPHIATVKRKTP